MKYLIIFEYDNGYNCNCCREEWETHDVMDFESKEQLMEYVNNYNKNDENNGRIIKVYKLADETPVFED